MLVEEKAQTVKSVKFVNSKSSCEGERGFPRVRMQAEECGEKVTFSPALGNQEG